MIYHILLTSYHLFIDLLMEMILDRMNVTDKYIHTHTMDYIFMPVLEKYSL